MNLSVMLFPFHSQLSDGSLSPKGLVEELHAAGVRALEPMLRYVESDMALWGELRRAADDLGMEYSCYDIGANLVGESEADRREALDVVARGVEFCAELKCPIALIAGSRPAPDMSNEEGRKLYADGLAKAAERAEGSGITLTIEDFGVYPEFTASAVHVLEVLEGANRPDLKFTLDNGNFMLADERPSECYALLKDRIVHVHIKDFAPRESDDASRLTSLGGKQYVGSEIGEGAAEVAECLRLLKGDGYRGWLSLEVGTKPPLDAAIRGARYAAEVWQE